MPKTHALVAPSPDCIELQEVAIADPDQRQAVVQSQYSVMSPGTELRCIAGKQADGPFPLVPGYSSAGVVLKAGKNSGVTEGDTVCCPYGGRYLDVNSQFGGHAQHLLVPGDALRALPDNVSTQQAAICKMAAIAYHGFQMAKPTKDTPVIVLGLGLIGQLSARLFNTVAPTLACDLCESRVEQARACGIDAMVIDEKLQPVVSDRANSADIVADSTGVPAVIDLAVPLLRSRTWGVVDQSAPLYLIQGSYADHFKVDYFNAFLKEACFLLARDHGRSDVSGALAAIDSGVLVVDDLIEYEIHPADAPHVYEQLRDRSDLLTAAVNWSKL